jgi:hypothetical protein
MLSRANPFCIFPSHEYCVTTHSQLLLTGSTDTEPPSPHYNTPVFPPTNTATPTTITTTTPLLLPSTVYPDPEFPTVLSSTQLMFTQGIQKWSIYKLSSQMKWRRQSPWPESASMNMTLVGLLDTQPKLDTRLQELELPLIPTSTSHERDPESTTCCYCPLQNRKYLFSLSYISLVCPTDKTSPHLVLYVETSLLNMSDLKSYSPRRDKLL